MVTRYFSQLRAGAGRSTKQVLGVPPRVGWETCRPTRIEAGISSGETREIARKVSFHVAHSFRPEETQLWAKTCGREPDCDAIFLTQCLDAKSDLAKIEMA
jgi:hypothetical protein